MRVSMLDLSQQYRVPPARVGRSEEVLSRDSTRRGVIRGQGDG